ncbi:MULTISPECIES: methylated-DNA--[protein]-cysteine S-methyltransferase [Ramlibacter]|uniref:Methylated-DNA--protein-cysteine methyltransferase n=1 Tax=Ramlibacter aquaticus TaxID=2780094 RepID=A0ABR9SHU2_9BURK|nr:MULTISPECIES: methylated-DNA--[protein]-cysteine S-methyltransferase [Ramlibacter]MBE7941744.1 methylated-DNA--[protein]-cysteine S-methyltransferase [Ramlibacter aquaticus]
MKFTQALHTLRWEGPLGPMLLAASDSGIAGIWFEGQRHMPDTRGWTLKDTHPLLTQAVAQLQDYFAGRRAGFDLPLDLSAGTGFQQGVWRALLGVPHGRTTTYGELGRLLGRERGMRAVGAAVGRNPVSVVVPCHRVLGKDGSLTGYAGGLERKDALLRLEGAA